MTGLFTELHPEDRESVTKISDVTAAIFADEP